MKFRFLVARRATAVEPLISCPDRYLAALPASDFVRSQVCGNFQILVDLSGVRCGLSSKNRCFCPESYVAYALIVMGPGPVCSLNRWTAGFSSYWLLQDSEGVLTVHEQEDRRVVSCTCIRIQDISSRRMTMARVTATCVD